MILIMLMMLSVLQFEDMKVSFQLVSMTVAIKESKEKPEIIKLSVIDLKAMLTQRSSAQAIKYSPPLPPVIIQ